jgi:hypothetical protein
MQNKWWAKVLRVVGIVLMGLTAIFTIMAGAGTTCVALNPTGYDGKFAGIAPFQWLYIAFVLVTVAIGVLGVRAVVLLITGSKKAYSSALVALIAGTVVNGIHLIASRQLRGSSMPVDMVFYVNVLTLIVFLLFKIPPIWQAINFDRPSKGEKFNQQALAIVLASTGILTLTIQFLMAPTHTIGQVNYADVWHLTLSLLGAAQIVSGVFMALRGTRPDPKLEVQPDTVQG